jgi:dihydroorotase-like cyclic amidohydrolase
MLYSRACSPDAFLDQFVALTSANAARIFASTCARALSPSPDADIALWTLRYRRVDGARMQSLSGYSVYDGWQVQAAEVRHPPRLVRAADGQLRPAPAIW